MKICHLTSAHPDNDIRIFHKECISLQKNGFEVHLIVPNTESRVEKNVQIHSFSTQNLGRFNRMKQIAKQVYLLALKINADVYHFHDPELLPYGLKLQKRGKKVIYDAHEDVPRQILAKEWIPYLLRKPISFFFERYENRVAKKLSFIIVSTPTIKERFIKINPNTEAICNYPILEENEGLPIWETRKNQVCYIGGITVIRGIYEMVQAFENIENTELILAGVFGPEHLKNEVEKIPSWNKVKHLGFINRTKIIEVLNSSKIGLVLLHPEKNYLDSLPIKMFEYMYAGIPVIASNFPLWKNIIDETKCGVYVNPVNTSEIATQINYLLSNPEISKQMGENGRKAIISTYNWRNEEKKLIEIYSLLK